MDEIGGFATVDGDLMVCEANPCHVVRVIMAEQYAINLGTSISQCRVFECVLGIESPDLREKPKLKIVASPIYRARLNTRREVFFTLREASSKIHD